MRFAMEIPYLVAPPQEAEYPVNSHNSELLRPPGVIRHSPPADFGYPPPRCENCDYPSRGAQQVEPNRCRAIKPALPGIGWSISALGW